MEESETESDDVADDETDVTATEPTQYLDLPSMSSAPQHSSGGDISPRTSVFSHGRIGLPASPRAGQTFPNGVGP